MYAFAMRLPARLLLGVVLACTAVAACKPAAPVAEQKKRRSFEDSWQPSAPAAAAPAAVAPSGNAAVDAQAQQVQQSWEQARQTTDEAERQRLAGEALKQTRSMADQPSAQPSPQ